MRWYERSYLASHSFDVIQKMKIVLCSLGQLLTIDHAQSLNTNFSDVFSLPERTSTISLGVQGSIDNFDTDYLFNYDVFPSCLMKHKTEWDSHSRTIRKGDIIIQRAVIPPIGFGLCMEFAVRISNIISENGKVGFSYETLVGHAESGLSEFYFEENEGELYFTIHTYSEPGHWTSKFFNYFSIPYQRWCTQKALNHVKKRFHQINKTKDNKSVFTTP